MICKLFRQQRAPVVEVDKFNVNLLEYQYFSAMFNKVLEGKIKNFVGRFTDLSKCTDYEAKDLINH